MRRAQKSAASARLPDFIEPMQAKLVDSIPHGDWLYEVEFDGYRSLALRGGTGTRILSRNQNDPGKKFTEVRDSIAALDVTDAIIDGEIVALDDKGRSSFQLLQAFEMNRNGHQLCTTHSICSNSTARIFETYRSKNGRRSWKRY